MALGRKSDKGSGSGMYATALVVDADPPAAGPSRWGSTAKGSVTILVEHGPEGPIHAARDLKLTEDRWLVRGMEIPVSIDPAVPERFEVQWDAIPSIEERVAANDPTLADPLATLRKIAAALEAAGISGPAPGAGRRGMTGFAAGGSTAGDPGPDHFEEALEEAARKPVPPGKQRAVVVVATATSIGDSSGSQAIDPNTNGPP